MKRSLLSPPRVELLSTFKHHGGCSYGEPILLDGDTGEEPLRSKLVLFENDIPLRRGHEHHATIAGTGRGAYSHWERYLFFSASDNTDPNTNGRTYSFAVDHAGQHQSRDDGRTLLNGPFYLQDGLCWGVVVADDGDDAEARILSALRLFENDKPLGPSHAIHTQIERHGAGRYSHWKRYLYFSTSDGSDPNANGRLYTYELDDSVAFDHADLHRRQHQQRDDGRTLLNAPFSPGDGLCWATVVPDDGDDADTETLSMLRLYEDDRPLGPRHTLHAEIEQNGAGRYSHWQHHLYFSSSDGSDPNENGRLYSYEISDGAAGDHAGRPLPREDGRIPLSAPFRHSNGLSWGVAVADDGDVLATEDLSTMRLYENDTLLGPGHTLHTEIEQHGAGRYSHWRRYLYFSTSDGSDPNTNGRLYSYDVGD